MFSTPGLAYKVDREKAIANSTKTNKNLPNAAGLLKRIPGAKRAIDDNRMNLSVFSCP
jgi:hypothetical protein